HGRATEVFSRLHLEFMGVRGTSWKARRCLHVHANHPRRPGSDAALDDAALATPRDVSRGNTLHGARIERDERRGNALWRIPRSRPTRRGGAYGSRTSACPSVGKKSRRSGSAASEKLVEAPHVHSACPPPNTSRINRTVSRRWATNAA